MAVRGGGHHGRQPSFQDTDGNIVQVVDTRVSHREMGSHNATKSYDHCKPHNAAPLLIFSHFSSSTSPNLPGKRFFIDGLI